MFATISAIVGGVGGVVAICENTMDAISAANTRVFEIRFIIYVNYLLTPRTDEFSGAGVYHEGKIMKHSMPGAIAGVLVAAFLAQSFLASRIKSPTFDETTHIAAGLSYVQTGEIRANLQHPPLLK